MRSHTFEDWGERFVDTITTQEIRELIKRRVGHCFPSHQKYMLKGIRGAFKYALEAGYIHFFGLLFHIETDFLFQVEINRISDNIP